MSSTNFIQDDNLGSDFDDAEHHVQDSSKFKVKCGFDTIDHMLGGGWDRGTLSMIMGESNSGKCEFFTTICHIKNTLTGKDESVMIGDFFKNIRQCHKDE